MSYMALYRKFRPQNFDEVRGQEAVVTTLKNQIINDRIGHAYLFCGTRGTGKTSVAKVFAKAVNCENPVNGNPCNTCAMCRRITEGSSLNVVEIDAASNNGVDNIREIVEEVQYRPSEGRFRVYIIDEVHMLSAGAFNALLKTLEEPPSYVIFILATTEMHKIPVTILSRCQRYDFHRIGSDVIEDRMRELAEKEGIDAEPRALAYIAKRAEGAMRDALSLLDQCASYLLGEKLTYEKTLTILGASDSTVYRELLRYMLAKNPAGAVRIYNDAIASGGDTAVFVSDYIWYLRNLLLMKAAGGDASSLIDLPQEQLAELREDAGNVPEDTVLEYIRTLSELSCQLRYAANARVTAETALIGMSVPKGKKHPAPVDEEIASYGYMPEYDLPEYAQPAGYGIAPAVQQPALEREAVERLLKRIENLEKKVKENEEAARIIPAPQSAAGAVPPKAPQTEKPAENQPVAAPEDLQRVCDNWQSIVSLMKDGFARLMLKDAVPKIDPKAEHPVLYVELSNPLAERLTGRNDAAEEMNGIILRKFGYTVPVVLTMKGSGPADLAPVRIEERLRAHIHMDIEETDEEEF